MRTRTTPNPRGPVVAAVVLLALLGAAGLVPLRPATSGPTAAAVEAHVAEGAARSGPGSSPSPPLAEAGSTVETLLPNYNGSLPGNLPSTVDDWEIGTPAFVPVSNTLWLPEYPTSSYGPAAPIGAPAVVFNLTTSSFAGFVPTLSNASALVYDPGDGYLYACDSATNSIEVFDPHSGAVVDRGIPVGNHPDAIAYDPENQYLFVANGRSNNVTVINAKEAADQVIINGISVKSDPNSLAIDPGAYRVFVSSGNSSFVTILNANGSAIPIYEAEVSDPATGLAFSEESNLLAVAMPSSSLLEFITPAGAPRELLHVGTGAESVVASSNGLTFVVSNESGSRLILLNSTTGKSAGTNLTTPSLPSELTPISGTPNVEVWSAGSRNLSVLNLSEHEVSPQSVTLGPVPNLLADSPTLGRLFIGDGALAKIETLDLSSGATIPVPFDLSSIPTALAVDPSTQTLFVGQSGVVSAFNDTTGQSLYTNGLLPGPNGPFVVDTSAGMLWDARAGASRVTALNLTTLRPEANATSLTVESDLPESMVLEPMTSEVFAVDAGSGNVAVFNALNGTLVGTVIHAGQNLTSLVYDSTDGLVYAAGINLTAIDPLTLNTVGTPLPLPTHVGDVGLAFDPSRGLLYASTTAPGTSAGVVTVVGGTNVSSLGNGPVASFPDGLGPAVLTSYATLNPDLNGSDFVLSANSLSGTVGLIGVPPAVSAFSFEPAEVDEDQTAHAVVVAVGGVGISTVGYSGLPTGCRSQNVLNLSCVPAESGNFSVRVTVTDLIGETATTTALLEVGSSLRLAAQFGAREGPIVDVGLPFKVSASASGGTPPYTYRWNFGDGTNASGSSITHRFASAGTYPVVVAANDSVRGFAVESALVHVYPLPVASPYGSPGLSTDVGLSVPLFGNVSGGAPGGTGLWNFGDGQFASGINVTHTWTTRGSYTVTFSYEDPTGQYANASVPVNVASVLTGKFTAIPVSQPAVPGTVFDLTAAVHNGTAPYTINWSLGGGLTATGMDAATEFSSPGTFTIGVTVTDSAGAVLTTSVTVTVVAPPKGSSSVLGGNFGPGLAVGLFAGAAIAAVLLFAAERTRRRTLPAPPSPYVPPPSAPPPGKRP